MIRLTNILNEVQKDDLQKYVMTGSEFKNKYLKDFKGKVAKVIYKNNLNIGSNMGKGEYWCVTQDTLDIYSGERDREFGSRYAAYADKIVYKALPSNLKIVVKDGIAWDLWMGKGKKKLYDELTKIADGVYDPEQDDYGLLIFKSIK